MKAKSNEFEYIHCVGCGLCEAQFKKHVKMKVNDEGFIRQIGRASCRERV